MKNKILSWILKIGVKMGYFLKYWIFLYCNIGSFHKSWSQNKKKIEIKILNLELGRTLQNASTAWDVRLMSSVDANSQ